MYTGSETRSFLGYFQQIGVVLLLVAFVAAVCLLLCR